MASPRSWSGHWSGASRAPPPCTPSPRTRCCRPGSVIRLDITLRMSLTIIYLGHQAPGGVDTFPDEGLQLGALADGGVVKQRWANLRHHVLQGTVTIRFMQQISLFAADVAHLADAGHVVVVVTLAEVALHTSLQLGHVLTWTAAARNLEAELVWRF